MAAPTSTASRLARALPLPAGAGLARMLVERSLRALRHGWLTVASGFFEPVFYLASLGVGPGATVPHAVCVAPALTASSAMNGAVYDSTFDIFFKLKHARVYDAALATPLGTRDIAVGEITWALLRGQVYAIAFLLVARLAGLVPSWWALAALPAAGLIGVAFAAVGVAATTWMRSWTDFDLVRLAIVPLFLFSATFFPLSTYPGPVQVLVQATPLHHGVALLRALLLGEVGPGLLVHAACLAVMGGVGLVVAARRLERTLLP